MQTPDNHTEDFEATVDENRFREKLLSFQSKAGWLTNFEKENADQLNENECTSVICIMILRISHLMMQLLSFQNIFQS